jgi:MFS family permease
MQLVSLSWLVYRLTNSAFILGCVGFATQLPTVLLSPLAGVIADRHDRRRILLVVQILSMVQAAALTFLILTGTVAVWHVFVLGIFLGIVNAFDIPTRQAFVSEMVGDRKDMNNAIALHSSLFNSSRLIGPAVAGILIAAFGEGVCFAFNTVSFIPIIVALLMMKIAVRPQIGVQRHVVTEFKEGFRYAIKFMPIRTLLLLLTVVSFLAGGLQPLLPVFVREVYHGGPRAFGFVTAMSGVGALVGSLYLAGRRTVVGLGRMIGAAAVGMGISFALFGFVTHLYLAGAMAFGMGLAMILVIGSTNMVLQTIVEEDKRGRVMSLYGAALIGMAPVGSLVAGAATGRVGLSVTVVGGGILCLMAAWIYWHTYPYLRTQLRAVYVRMGIIPEV